MTSVMIIFCLTLRSNTILNILEFVEAKIYCDCVINA